MDYPIKGKSNDAPAATGASFRTAVRENQQVHHSISMDVYQESFIRSGPRVHKLHDLPNDERPTTKLMELGAGNLSTGELLACVIQSDNALWESQELMTRFNGLAGLSSAASQELIKIPGIGPATATRLLAALELGKRSVYKQEREHQIKSPSDAAQFLAALIGNSEQELFVVLCLDTRNRVIANDILYKGTVNTSLVRTAEVFRGAIRRNSTGVIISHNHPSGDPEPSPEDINLTRRLVDAGKLLEVDILDHIVVGSFNRYMSMRERNYHIDWS